MIQNNHSLSNASLYSSYGNYVDKYIKFTYPDTFAGTKGEILRLGWDVYPPPRTGPGINK